jgi:hypothetical protein
MSLFNTVIKNSQTILLNPSTSIATYWDPNDFCYVDVSILEGMQKSKRVVKFYGREYDYQLYIDLRGYNPIWRYYRTSKDVDDEIEKINKLIEKINNSY